MSVAAAATHLDRGRRCHVVRRGRPRRRRRASRSRRRARPRPCRSSQHGQEPQQPGCPTDAEEQHAGRVGIERAGVADLPRRRAPCGAWRRRRATSSPLACRRRRSRQASKPSSSGVVGSSAIGGSSRRISSTRSPVRTPVSGWNVSVGVRFRRAWRPIAAWTRLGHRRAPRAPRRPSPRREGCRTYTTARRRSGSTSTAVMVTSSSRSSSRRSSSSAEDLAHELVHPRRAGILRRVGCARGRLGFLTRATSSRSSSTSHLGKRPHEPLDLVDDVASRGAGCRRRPRTRARRAATGRDGRPRRRPRRTAGVRPRGSALTTLRFSFSDRDLGQVQIDGEGEHVHGSAPVAQVRGSRAPRRSR